MLNNNLIRKFCGNDFQDTKWLTPPKSLKTEEFDEIRHWHCQKPLTDDWDHVNESFAWDDSRITLWRNMTPDKWYGYFLLIFNILRKK